jgi:hypothetical protein
MSSHGITNDNRAGIANSSITKNLYVKSSTFPYRSIHNYTWISDGKTQYQTDHVLIDKRWNSNIVDVQSFRGTDHCLVDAEDRDRLSVSKRAAQKIYMERYNVKKKKT